MVTTLDLEAYILCGGLGTRLRSQVSDRPKVLAPIQGRPFLEILVEHLCRQGVNRFVLCAGYRGEMIQAAIPKLRKGCEVRLSLEDRPLGTGGALRHALAPDSSDLILALNGDSICPVDLSAMLAKHSETGAMLTLALVRAEKAADYGSVRLASDGWIESFAEKATEGTAIVNAGVYLIDAPFFRARAPQGRFSLETDLFPTLATEHRIQSFVHDGAFLDIGTPERYRDAAQCLRDLGLV